MLKKLAAIIVLSFAFAGTASADALNDAMAEYEAANYKAALAGFKPLAEQGNAKAQHYLVDMYARHRDPILDSKEAIKR